MRIVNRINGDDFTVTTDAQLRELLPEASNFRRIFINDFNPELFRLALPSLASLQALCLRGCGINEEGTALIIELVRLGSLSNLNLACVENNMGENGVAIARALAESTSLQNLNLKTNYIGKYGLEVAKALAGSNSLQTLDLSFNQIEDPAITVELAQSRSLQTLNLSNNNIGPHVGALAKSTSLKTLKLHYINIGAHGGKVAEELSESNSLQTLALSNHHIGQHGIAIANALAKSNSLQTLILTRNELGQDGVAVATALAKSNSLRILDLKFNNLEGYEEEVANALADSNFIIEVIGIEITATLQATLDKNRSEFVDQFFLSEQVVTEESAEDMAAAAAPETTELVEDAPEAATTQAMRSSLVIAPKALYPDLCFLNLDPRHFPLMFGEHATKVEKIFRNYFIENFFSIYGVSKGWPGEAKITKDADGEVLPEPLIRQILPAEVWWKIISCLSLEDFNIGLYSQGGHLHKDPQIEELSDNIIVGGADAAPAAFDT